MALRKYKKKQQLKFLVQGTKYSEELKKKIVSEGG